MTEQIAVSIKETIELYMKKKWFIYQDLKSKVVIKVQAHSDLGAIALACEELGIDRPTHAIQTSETPFFVAMRERRILATLSLIAKD